MTQFSSPSAAADSRVTLRLLGTTDVHAHLLPFDYFSGAARQPRGLSRVATLIAQARAEAPNSLLFDNGDFLQGTPLSDMTAAPGTGWQDPHPVIAAMNRLGYDAATLGNHEFNFGLDHLRDCIAQAAFPVVCANVLTPGGNGPLFQPYTLLNRRVSDHSGRQHLLRIGVLGLVPPQVARWDHAHLSGHAETRCMVEAARALLPRIRAAGADVILVLAHTGIDPGPDHDPDPGPETGPDHDPGPDHDAMENAARPLARLPGVDALMLGHTHLRLPGPDHAGIDGVDARAGTVHGTPAIMAGFGGGHLGILDLTLAQDSTGAWRVTGHKAQLRATSQQGGARPVQTDRAITRLLDKAHRATLHQIARPIGTSPRPLHSYLSLARGDDPALRLICAAQQRAATALLDGTADAGLPVLAAAAPFKTGGRAGPEHFTDVPAGPLSLRHAADIYVFPNTLVVLRLTGAEILDYLERAACGFHHLSHGQADQPLRNPRFPGHEFDVIDGLTYRIDLSQPARFDANGTLARPDARRIRDLRHQDRPVDPDAVFALAVNNYRAFGGGPCVGVTPNRIIVQDTTPIRDHLAAFLASPESADWHERDRATPPTWRFVPMAQGTSALLLTGPGLRRHAADIDALGLEDHGDDADGFARFRLPLSD